MTVYKSGSGWYMRFLVAGHPRVHEPTYAKTKAGAKKVEAERRLAMIEGDDPRTQKAPILKLFVPQFEAYIDACEESGSLSRSTARYYRNGLRMLDAAPIMGMRLDKITTPDTETLVFHGENGEQLSGSTANNALRTLRRIFSYACKKKVMGGRGPIVPLREELGREAVIDDWAQELMLECAGPILRDVLIIIIDCGARPAEVCRMRWEYVRWHENAILIPHGKSLRARRFVGMTDRMHAVLTARRDNGSEWVFPSRPQSAAENRARAEEMRTANPKIKVADIARTLGVSWTAAKNYLKPEGKDRTSASGHIIATSVGGKMWREMIKRVEQKRQERNLPELPHLVLYCSRHTYGTNFSSRTGDTAKLKKLMGHASITTTEKYLHPSIADAAEVMNKHNVERKFRVEKKA